MPVRAYNTRILIDQFSFSLQTKGIGLAFSVESLDVNTLQVAESNMIPDASHATLNLNGYFSGPGAGQLEQELQTRFANAETPCIVTACFDTTVLGNPAYSEQTFGKELAIDGSDKLIMVKGQWEDNLQRGLVIAHATVTGIGDQPVIDFGAAGVNGGWAVLHVRAIGGTTVGATFQVKCASSVGFGSPTTLGSFGVFAVGAQRLTFAGAVGRYLRLGCTALGGATSFDVTAVAGVFGVTG